MFDEEKTRSQRQLGVRRELIRNGGEADAGFYAEKAGSIAGKLGELRSKTESIREDIEQRVRGVTGIFRPGEGSSPVKEVMAAGERAVDEIRGRVDTAVKSGVEALGAPAAPEIARWPKRIHDPAK